MLRPILILLFAFVFIGCTHTQKGPARATPSPEPQVITCEPPEAAETAEAGIAPEGANHAPPPVTETEVETVRPYPFNTCAVQITRPFKDGIPKHRRVYQGQEVLFCCTPCVKAFDAYPDPFMPRIIEAAKAKEAAKAEQEALRQQKKAERRTLFGR